MRSPGIRLHKLALFGWAIVITAVLLLLSLPVLAGKHIKLPVLNLAIYWKLLYIYRYITQSVGNHLGLNLDGFFRDYTPKYFHCRSLHSTNKRGDGSPSPGGDGNINNLPFAAYLAGIIEGDGTIIVPDTLRSPKGKLNYPSIQIVFHSKDLPLALMIQKELGFGSISKGVNAYILTINNYEGILLIISLLNGNMRTPKINSLYKLIDFYPPPAGAGWISSGKPLNNKPLESNGWLSGFIEADGSFQVRSTLSGKYPKFECKLEISQRQTDHKGFSNQEFLNKIADLFDTEVKETRLNKSTPEYRVRTTNLQGNNKAKNYLIKYPLFGTKYLDSIDWMKVVDLFNNGEHKTELGKEKILNIKSNMNDKRTVFTWDHLQNFYKLKI